jgi:hypothetical protein
MSEGDKSGGEGRKLSRLEREREKIRIAQENINRLLAVEKEKQRKQDTRDKILLGVMLQGMIADGAISTEVFEAALEKYLTNDKDRERCDAYFDEHRPKGKKV